MASENWQYMGPPISAWGMITGLLKRNVVVITNAGAPTNGTSGTAFGKAGPGSLCIDYTNGQLYINTNTLASPTWTKISDAIGDLPLARGFVIRGSSAGLAEALDANDTGKILVGDGTDINSVAVSGDATLSAAGAVTIGAVVNGSRLATVANVNVIGGVAEIYRITATNLTGNVDVVVTNKSRIIDVLCINTTGAGGAGDTIQVLNTANAISDVMDLNKADKTITRALTIDDTFWDIPAAGTLRITGASAVNCEVIVTAIPVP